MCYGAGALAATARYGEAVADFDQALSMDPTMDFIFYERGDSQHKREHYTEALADYDKGLQADPDWIFLFLRHGLALYALKQYEEAERDFATSSLGGLEFLSVPFLNEVRTGLLLHIQNEKKDGHFRGPDSGRSLQHQRA